MTCKVDILAQNCFQDKFITNSMLFHEIPFNKIELVVNIVNIIYTQSYFRLNAKYIHNFQWCYFLVMYLSILSNIPLKKIQSKKKTKKIKRTLKENYTQQS